MNPSSVEIVATVVFALAVLHTFAISRFQHLASRFPEGSVSENVFHLLGEVEIVFGLWSAVLVLSMAALLGRKPAIDYVESRNFTEPLFVFAIMTVAATRPVIQFTRKAVVSVSRFVPGPREMATYITILVLGPLLGSLITEPAAMTVTALLLKDRYYDHDSSDRFKYITLAVLFVNVSIGGVLTPYAAPPVLMVANKWNWDITFMLQSFGWKAALGCLLNALLATGLLFKELRGMENRESFTVNPVPGWITAVHIFFLVAIVTNSHHSAMFIGLLVFFLGVATITREYQDELKLRQSLLVGFFLAGLVLIGGLQSWWLDPVLRKLDALPLFIGTAALTTITDNAALTYLGSQVENVSELFKYALVGGAIAGGGVTVIANAPNPAGFSILQESFGLDGISPLKLALAALAPTLVAMACLWLL